MWIFRVWYFFTKKYMDFSDWIWFMDILQYVMWLNLWTYCGPALANDMQSSSPPRKEPYFFGSKSCIMFWNEWRINIPMYAIFVFEICSFKFLRITRKKIIFPKVMQCSETDFNPNLTIFSFSGMVDLYSTIVVNWQTERFCEPDSETLTNDTR